MISIQKDAFDAGALYNALAKANPHCGAIVTFCGQVRDLNDGKPIDELFLEHYPGMTEQVLEDIATEAKQRWSLGDVNIVHRIGALGPAEPIVFIGVASPHRKEAFDAATFIMDILKTKAPFWKRERSGEHSEWVKSRHSDQEMAQRWQE